MSDSEDGQLQQSPGNDDGRPMSTSIFDVDDDEDDEEEHDADSLNIKPPQAIITHSRERDSHGFSGRHGKDQLSGKDKKHSKERRHKERSSLKERESRGERDRRDYTGGGASSGERRRDERSVTEMERYPVRGNYDRRGIVEDSHDVRRSYARHFDRGEGRGNHYHHQHYHQQYHHIQHIQQRQQHHHDYYERTASYHHNSGEVGLDYHNNRQYNKHSGSSAGTYGGVGGSGNHHDEGLTTDNGDRDRERERERDRRKYASSNDQPPKDAESLEQDLRSRLLSKRHKYARTSGSGGVNDEVDDVEYEKSHNERVRLRREKKRVAVGSNNSVIEVLDSPDIETNNHYKSRHRHKYQRTSDTSPVAAVAGAIIEKRKTPDDPDLLARRAKFLAAEREKELRKESAREELQARREMLRKSERNENPSGTLSPSAVAASVTAGLNVIKRKVQNETTNRQIKRKRANEKSRSVSVQNVEHDEPINSEVEESGDGGSDDDDSVSLSPSEGDTDSQSASDSGAAVSLKSISPRPATKEIRKRKKRYRVNSDQESSKSKDVINDHNDDDVSEHSYYEKTKLKRKSSKNSKVENMDAVTHAAHSDIESRSESASPVESEDSFYAERKREKHMKDNDGENSTDRHDKDFYRSSKSSKATRKSKKRSKGKHKDDDEDEELASESSISEGSIKTHRARKNRKKKKSSGEDDSSMSRSDASDVESEESYYEKKKRHRHHRKETEKQGKRKSKRKSVDDGSNISASSVSGDSQEEDDVNDIDFGNGLHGESESGSDEDHVQQSRKRKYSSEANQFLADINDVDMKDLSKEETRKDHRGNDAENGADSVTLEEDEVETIYDDKGVPLPNYYPGIQGCRTVEEFQWLNRIEEGTYGVVYRARDQRTNEIVALKRLKMEKELEGFPITSLREINTLLKGQHPNIVTVREIVVGSNMDKIFIVMDYVEHDLKSLMETMKARKQIFFPGEVKCLTQQLLRAVNHLHDNWILHRDLKTSNLLLSHKGILKVGDFGLAREYGSPLRKYTSLVVTRWYRAPELLLCSPMYSTPIDIWSVGCIFAEFLLMTPYLPGRSDIDQLNRIFRELGTPNEKIWPGYNELPAVKNVLSQNTQFADYPMSNLRKRFADKVSDSGISLLQGLLTYDPKQRLTAEAALDHVYFKELPLPIDPAMFPTWPAKSEMGASRKAAHSPKPPSGGAQFKKLGQDDMAINVGKSSGITTSNANQSGNKVVSGIITGNKKTGVNTGFVLNAGIDQRQLAMGPGFNLKF